MDDERQQRLWRLATEKAERREVTGWAGLVCAVAVEHVEVDAAAISLRSSTRSQELAASSDPWAERFEELQYTVGQGPGTEAYDTGGPVLVADLADTDQRWPGLIDAVLAAGLAAVFAFPLRVGGIRLGTFTLYRRRPGPLSADDLANATVLADMATTALLSDASAFEPARHESLGHYDDVNIATGMLAVELRVSLDDAFARLQAHAFSNGQTLLDVARALVTRQLQADAFQD